MRAVLVANRGEIACRILATVRARGLRAIAVYSDADASAAHVDYADEAWRIGPAPAADSYLAAESILAAAASAGADAIHPGYGFLAEDPAFARAVVDAGLTWIGPPADAIEAMGDKIAAKQRVEAAGVPVIAGVHEPGLDDEALSAAAESLGVPLLVKAAAGGGGRGMRVVADLADLPEALAGARREAAAAFGSGALLLERLVQSPRHVEVQVLADGHGEVIALGERECSLQRRHQKIVEEAPSPAVDADLRAAMADAAIAAARACGYVGAGTVELLLEGGTGHFAFLEMNTRLQVEHPVTEAIYGLDLVGCQLDVATGRRLAEILPTQPTASGHAIEARVYAEDPAAEFRPTGGQLQAVAWPSGAGIRVDAGVKTGEEVGSHYDPLLAKVIAHGPDRRTALARLERALDATVVLGMRTNVGFLRALLCDPDVVEGRLDTGLVERVAASWAPAQEAVPDEVLAVAALIASAGLEPDPASVGASVRATVVDPFDVPDGWRISRPAPSRWLVRCQGRTEEVAVLGRPADASVTVGDGAPRGAGLRSLAQHPGGGQTLTVAIDESAHRGLWAPAGAGGWLAWGGAVWEIELGDDLAAAGAGEVADDGPVAAPLPGTVAAVHVSVGEAVVRGQALVTVEAMKMEHPVAAPVDGAVTEVRVSAGDQVAISEVLAVVVGE